MLLLHVVFFATGITICVVFLFYKIKFLYWRRLGVPHPEPSIPCGNIDGTKVQLVFGIDKLYKRFKETAAGLPFFGIYFMHQPWAVLTDLELIKNVFIREFQTFPERDLYANEKDDPLSAHLSAVGFQNWRRLRPKLSPSFSSGKMRAMFPLMMEVSRTMVKCMDGMMVSGGRQDQEIEVKDVLGRMMTEIIARCMFGIECNSLEDTTNRLREMGKKSLGVPRFSGLTINLIKSWKSVSRALRVKVVLDDVSSFFMKFVNEVVKYREENESGRNDLMDTLVRMKNATENPLSVDEIAAQSFIMFLAGFENSSLTVAFTLYELALNPEIQSKARAEIFAVMRQQEDGLLTYDAIMKLTYVEQVINGNLLILYTLLIFL